MSLQKTRLQQNLIQSLQKFRLWINNPWRRISLLSMVLLLGFFIGTVIGTVSGAVGIMDPVGALVVIIFIELMLRLRPYLYRSSNHILALHLIDVFRIGLIYGLLLEGFKLL